MPVNLSLFANRGGLTDTMVIYRKSESLGLGKDEYEIREPINPPLNLKVRAWFSPNKALGRLLGSQEARNRLSDLYKGIDRLFTPIHVTTGLFRALNEKHGEPLVRSVMSYGPTSGSGASKLARTFDYYRRTYVPEVQSDHPDSWQI